MKKKKSLVRVFMGNDKEKPLAASTAQKSSSRWAASRVRQKVSVRVMEEVLVLSSCSQQHKNEKDVSMHTRAIHYRVNKVSATL